MSGLSEEDLFLIKAKLGQRWILNGHGVSDSEIARAAGDFKIELRNCPALGGWFHWTGGPGHKSGAWEPVSKEMARSVVREWLTWQIEAAEAYQVWAHRKFCKKRKGTHATKCLLANAHAGALARYESAHGLSNVLTELASRPEILVDDAAAFDAHPYLLNTQNGVVDLRDGSLKPADQDLLLTRMTRAKYVPHAAHPDWTQALDALSGLNADTQQWLQQYLGSGASGHTLTDSLNVFLHGNGANGKSTVLGAIDTALGNYAGTVPDAALSATSAYEQKVAMLSFRGLRFALLEETSDDMRLATTAIKKLSSGNSISARVLGKGNVEFPASHTLAIATNHTPYVKETDKGTWRRLVLVPFAKDYTKEPAFDSDIRERLIEGDDGRAEAVLAWLVAGCIKWYGSKRLLTPLPAELQNATDGWRADSDLVGEFLRHEVSVTGEPDDRCSKADLYDQFKIWCELSNNENPYRSGQRGFNAAVKNHEYASGQLFEARGTGGVKQWGGVRSLGHSLVTTVNAGSAA